VAKAERREEMKVTVSTLGSLLGSSWQGSTQPTGSSHEREEIDRPWHLPQPHQTKGHAKSKMVFRGPARKKKDKYVLKSAKARALKASERYGIDYFSTSAVATSKLVSLHILLHISGERRPEIRHIDVAKAYLESSHTVIYMTPPQGMENENAQTRCVPHQGASKGCLGGTLVRHLTEM
jgi:hypothetical protein